MIRQAAKGAAQNKRPQKNHPDFAKMTSLEVAQYIKALMHRHQWGNRETAKHIGYSPAYVTQHLRLLELPEIFTPLINRIAPSEIYKLSVLHAKKPELVEHWLHHNPEPTNRDLTRFLKEARDPNYATTYIRQSKGFPYHFVGKHDGNEVKILLDRKPTDDMVWVHFTKSGIIREIKSDKLTRIHLENKKPQESISRRK